MRFKLNKEQMFWAIASEAQMAAKNASYCLTNQPMNEALAQIIGQAVAAGFKKMMDEAYTDDDFEKDIGLKS